MKLTSFRRRLMFSPPLPITAPAALLFNKKRASNLPWAKASANLKWHLKKAVQKKKNNKLKIKIIHAKEIEKLQQSGLQDLMQY